MSGELPDYMRVSTEVAAAEERGAKAFRYGLALDTNPYEEGGELHAAFEGGWMAQAQEEGN